MVDGADLYWGGCKIFRFIRMKLLYRGFDKSVFDRIIYKLQKENIGFECHTATTRFGKVMPENIVEQSPDEAIIEKSGVSAKINCKIYVKRDQYEQAKTILKVL